MALVPSIWHSVESIMKGTNAQNYFTQLLQKKQQINAFINDWSLEHTAEEKAESPAPYDVGCYLHGSKYSCQIFGSSCERRARKAFGRCTTGVRMFWYPNSTQR